MSTENSKPATEARINEIMGAVHEAQAMLAILTDLVETYVLEREPPPPGFNYLMQSVYGRVREAGISLEGLARDSGELAG